MSKRHTFYCIGCNKLSTKKLTRTTENGQMNVTLRRVNELLSIVVAWQETVLSVFACAFVHVSLQSVNRMNSWWCRFKNCSVQVYFRIRTECHRQHTIYVSLIAHEHRFYALLNCLVLQLNWIERERERETIHFLILQCERENVDFHLKSQFSISTLDERKSPQKHFPLYSDHRIKSNS